MKKYELLNRAMELRAANHSLDEISETLHISKSTAYNWLKHTPRKIPTEESKRKMLEALSRGRKNALKNKSLKPISELTSSTSFRKRIFGLKEKRCELCGWREKNPFYNEIPIEVHHVDGNKKNNKDSNIQILCPNCHSLTKFYGFFGRTHKSNGV